MRRLLVSAVVLLCLVCTAQGDEFFLKLKKGIEGDFDNSGRGLFQARVVRILGKDEMVMELGSRYFIVRGLSTADLADEARVELPGRWKCVGTKRSGGTYYVIEPVKPVK